MLLPYCLFCHFLWYTPTCWMPGRGWPAMNFKTLREWHTCIVIMSLRVNGSSVRRSLKFFAFRFNCSTACCQKKQIPHQVKRYTSVWDWGYENLRNLSSLGSSHNLPPPRMSAERQGYLLSPVTVHFLIKAASFGAREIFQKMAFQWVCGVCLPICSNI